MRLGPVFCAGMDLDDATAPDAPARTALHEPLFSLIVDSPKPIVAAVQGGAFGGGLGLVANAHVALAAQGTQFGLTEMRLGLWPFLIYRAVSHAVGERRATELSLTARLFGTTEALQFGLIHEVTPAFELEDRATAIAHGIANSSPAAVAAGLDLVRRSRHLNWQEAAHLASELRNQVLPGPDFAEGVRAFREKRRPELALHQSALIESSRMPPFLEEALELWRVCPDTPPPAGRSFDAATQAVCESHLERFIRALQAETGNPPRNRGERLETHRRITAAFTEFATSALGLGGAQLQLLLGDGLSSIGTNLARQARAFDASVATADILQACRNAWTACGLQLLFGNSMSLTATNLRLQHALPLLRQLPRLAPDAPALAKRGFGDRFGRCLAGETVDPANQHEEMIWRLVHLIEGEYDRTRYPQVFESLIWIHQTQMESLRLLRTTGSSEPVDVLRLSFAKGGSSVLADGYLAAGTLTAEQARFAFLWGIVLQLGDDLQDVREDLHDGVLTVFSQAAGSERRERLDRLTNRTLHFTRRVLALLAALPQHQGGDLNHLIQRSSVLAAHPCRR